MEIVAKQNQQGLLITDMRQRMKDISLSVSWREIANVYFKKSASWIYHKLDGIDGNGGKGGIQHVALRVDNIDAAIEELQEKGVKMIDKKARRGAGGADIAFIHPKSTGGILLEICELRDKREAY